MMLLKRLLLPGKGDVIICIFLLINVLLLWWCSSTGGGCSDGCGESVKSVTIINSPITIITSLLLYNSRFCGVVLVTYYFFVGSLQFPRSSASEVVLTLRDQTQKPVLNKTDPPSLMMMAVSMENRKGGGPFPSSYFHDYNYNKRRRRPVYISPNSNRSSINSSKISDLFSIPNPTSVSWSGGGDGVGGSATSFGWNPSDGTQSSHVVSYSNSSSRNSDLLGRTTRLNRRSTRKSHSVSVNSNRSAGNSSSKSTVVTLKRRKGRTRTFGNESANVGKSRKPKLLKEITLFNRQNCLAKLLCGVQVAQPPTKSSSALNDYAYLVKAFFDRFSLRGIVTDVVDAAFALEQDQLDVLDDDEESDDEDLEQDDDEGDDDDDDDESSERRKKKKRKKKRRRPIHQNYAGAQFHRARVPQYENFEPKYYEEYDRFLDDIEFEHVVDDNVPDFMSFDKLSKRKGKDMQFVAPFNGTGAMGVGVTGKRGKVPVDINRVRRRRGIEGGVKRGFMGFFNPRFDKTAYLNKRQLELESTENQAKRLNIAEEIAARLRSPRQCRLLNWFGTSSKAASTPAPQNTQTVPQSNAMQTTITTITNTGGMVGNLNGMQNLPPPAAAAAQPQQNMNNMNGMNINNMNTMNGMNNMSPMNPMANPGSQVVTVIQQSPVTAPTQSTTTTGTTTTTESLTATGAKAAVAATSLLKEQIKEYGQKATVAMNEMKANIAEAGNVATDVATHIGSTICPFTIAELQDLILKAQKAQFPHFLTTTKRPPGSFLPGLPTAQKKPQMPILLPPVRKSPPAPTQPPTPPPPPPSPPTRPTTTTTVATTTKKVKKIKTTKPPPPPTTTGVVIAARNRAPPPSSRHDPATFAQMFSSFQDSTPSPQYNHNPPQFQHNFDQPPTPPSSSYQMNPHHNHNYNQHYHHDPMQNQHNHNYHQNHNPQHDIPHFQHATPPPTNPYHVNHRHHHQPQQHHPPPHHQQQHHSPHHQQHQHHPPPQQQHQHHHPPPQQQHQHHHPPPPQQHQHHHHHSPQQQWPHYQATSPTPQYLPYDQPTHPPPSQYGGMNHHLPPPTVPPPIFPPSPVVYPNYPMPQKQADPEQQTRRPDDIPNVGMAGDEDDDDFEDEPYVTYETKNSPSIPPPPPTTPPTSPPPPSTKKPRPTPKWMTTTTPMPEDDELFSYNEQNAIPNYSYSKRPPIQQSQQPQHLQPKQQHLTHLQQPQHQNLLQSQQQLQHPLLPQSQQQLQHPLQQQPSQFQNYRVPPVNMKDPVEVQNFVREFQQPPVVVDTSAVYRPGAGTGLIPYHQQSPDEQLPQADIQPQGIPIPAHLQHPQHVPSNRAPQRKPTRPPQKKKKKASSDSEDDDGSEEDDSGSDEADDEDDDDEGSDEDGSSGSGEGRADMKMKQRPKPVPPKRPPPAKRPPPPPPPPSSSASESKEEGSDEEDGSNEEKKEDEEDEEEEESGEDDEDGDRKRSYERKNYAKDRLGSPASSSTNHKSKMPTKKPVKKRKESNEGGSSKPSGFFKNFLGSVSSYFNRDDANKKVNQNGFNNFFSKRMSPAPNPTTPRVPKSSSSKSTPPPNSDEEAEDDDDDEDSEESEEEESNEIPKQATKTNTIKRKTQTGSSLISSLISSWMPQTTTTTRPPVILHQIGKWAKTFIQNKLRNGLSHGQEDSGEEVLRQNPIQKYKEAIRIKKFNLKQKLKAGFFSNFLGKAEVNDNWISNDLHNPPPLRKRMGLRFGKSLEATGTHLEGETSGPPGGKTPPQPLD